MSPAPTRTPDDARVAALATADAWFYVNGIAAVSMADRDRSGASLRRLYSMFPHKSDLVTGWLQHRHESWIAMFTNGIDQRLATGQTPADAVFASTGPVDAARHAATSLFDPTPQRQD